MAMTDQADAVLVGGPRDQTLFSADDAALLELEIDGMIHRYIRTTQQRDQDGRSMAVYTYDGEVNPAGAQSGVETR
jgi:hypothetical protein